MEELKMLVQMVADLPNAALWVIAALFAYTRHTDAFIAQLNRLRGKRTNINSEYVHDCSVEWLREAIDEKEAREAAARKEAA